MVDFFYKEAFFLNQGYEPIMEPPPFLIEENQTLWWGRGGEEEGEGGEEEGDQVGVVETIACQNNISSPPLHLISQTLLPPLELTNKGRSGGGGVGLDVGGEEREDVRLISCHHLDYETRKREMRKNREN